MRLRLLRRGSGSVKVSGLGTELKAGSGLGGALGMGSVVISIRSNAVGSSAGGDSAELVMGGSAELGAGGSAEVVIGGSAKLGTGGPVGTWAGADVGAEALAS